MAYQELRFPPSTSNGKAELRWIPEKCPTCGIKLVIKDVGNETKSGQLRSNCEHTQLFQDLKKMSYDTDPEFSIKALKIGDEILVKFLDESSREYHAITAVVLKEGTIDYNPVIIINKTDIPRLENCVYSAASYRLEYDTLLKDCNLPKYSQDKHRLVSLNSYIKACKVNKNLLKKGAQKMSNNSTTTPNGFVDMFKDDLQEAGWRVASAQFTKVVKSGILACMKDKGMEEGKLGVVKEILESEIGNAIIASLLGYGLNYVPGLKEDKRIIKLASEFRVSGMATVGNEVMGYAMTYLLPAVQDAMKALPPLPEEDVKHVEEKVEEKVMVEKKATA